MEVIRTLKVAPTITPLGFAARFLVDKQSVEVINLLLEPGQTVQKHEAPVDTFFYVVSGRGVFEIGSETECVGEGDIVLSPACIPRGLAAAQDSSLSVLIVKTPNPKHLQA